MNEWKGNWSNHPEMQRLRNRKKRLQTLVDEVKKGNHEKETK